ncbi:hypothetical protein GGS26DRAFT_585760 [Hypomontagnella submonticulosa]|nr:hypothetical protein GGS26DRAFT_585760 [Hypomontagnella submonticulosa]
MDFEDTLDGYLHDSEVVESFIDGVNVDDPQLDDAAVDDLTSHIDIIQMYINDFRSLRDTSKAEKNDERVTVCEDALTRLASLLSQLEYIKQNDEESKSLAKEAK